MRPDEQRQTEPGQPRGAHLVDGDDEVQAGENRGKAGDEHPHRGGDDGGVRVGAAVRGVEGPAGVHPAGDHGIESEQGPDGVDVPAQQVDAGEGQVAGPDHHGHQEVPQHGGDRRNQEEEDHDDAVHGEQLVVGLRLHQVARRGQQLQPHQHREGAPHEEHQGDRDQVEDGDALVVGGEEPRLPPEVGAQVVLARQGWLGGGHCPCWRSSPRDLIKAINCSTCSSLNWPSKTGMMGR